MKTAFSTKENKSPGDGPFPLVTSETDVLRHKITICWGIFVAGARCEEHKVLMLMLMNTMCWWWKMRDAARRNPSHNRSTRPPPLATLLPLLPSLATLDTINQRFATGTKKRPLAGYCLFAKYDLFSADTGPIIAIALSCPVVSHLINQGIFCKPSWSL